MSNRIDVEATAASGVSPELREPGALAELAVPPLGAYLAWCPRWEMEPRGVPVDRQVIRGVTLAPSAAEKYAERWHAEWGKELGGSIEVRVRDAQGTTTHWEVAVFSRPVFHAARWMELPR